MTNSPLTGSVEQAQTKQPALSEVDQLKAELNDLKRKIDDDSKGLSGWVKKWGAYVAFLAAFFAVPQGLIDIVKFYIELRMAPETELFPTRRLGISYDPTQQTMQFQMNFSIANSGSTEELITEARTELWDAKSLIVRFSKDDIHLYENNAFVSGPFSVAKGGTRNLTYLALTSRDSISEFFQTPGLRRLKLELVGKNNAAHQMSFCFDVSKSNLTEMLDAQNTVTKTFVSQCE